VPLHVLIGREDEVSEDRARPWAKQTARSMRLHLFDGNHFFILTHWPQIGSIIHTELMGAAAESPRVDLGYEESQLDS
jgi:medium-chain acyl-[acyl-carrier-protein] hydrolase